jgi:hypothetical protein
VNGMTRAAGAQSRAVNGCQLEAAIGSVGSGAGRHGSALL